MLRVASDFVAHTPLFVLFCSFFLFPSFPPVSVDGDDSAEERRVELVARSFVDECVHDYSDSFLVRA